MEKRGGRGGGRVEERHGGGEVYVEEARFGRQRQVDDGRDPPPYSGGWGAVDRCDKPKPANLGDEARGEV